MYVVGFPAAGGASDPVSLPVKRPKLENTEERIRAELDKTGLNSPTAIRDFLEKARINKHDAPRVNSTIIEQLNGLEAAITEKGKSDRGKGLRKWTTLKGSLRRQQY